MRRPVGQGAPIVLKIGSSSLSADGGGVSREAIQRVVTQVQQLWAEGHPCVLVTSGAVAAGLPAMGLSERPNDLQGLQVAAAIGQSKLMELYGAEFGVGGRLTGQILITRDVLARRDQYLHARGALERMLSLGVVPIVNENDTVVVDELKLGDNDRLAAIVSHLVGAGMMICSATHLVSSPTIPGFRRSLSCCQLFVTPTDTRRTRTSREDRSLRVRWSGHQGRRGSNGGLVRCSHCHRVGI